MWSFWPCQRLRARVRAAQDLSGTGATTYHRSPACATARNRARGVRSNDDGSWSDMILRWAEGVFIRLAGACPLAPAGCLGCRVTLAPLEKKARSQKRD